ncbi:MAG: CoA-binding protein [Gammaproteobacteria bacterium]|nr:CoA-binding protein [Gammaproteobacteria bacterium]
MSFKNPDRETIRRILTESNSVAVVGLSPKPDRDSHSVSKALQQLGYQVIPVRPGVDELLGEQAYPDLKSLPELPDIVDVFRAPEHVPEIVDDAIDIGAKILWLQEGVVNEAAAEKAKKAGMTVIMNKCIYKEWVALKGGATP